MKFQKIFALVFLGMAFFSAGSAIGGTCTMTCPANATIDTDPGVCQALVAYPAPEVMGDCGTVTCTPASGSTFPLGTTNVNCTVLGGSPCSFTITVLDNEAPTITCPADITQTAPPTTVDFMVTATDNCPGVTSVCDPASGSSFPLGTSSDTCDATDVAGNTSNCSFSVTLESSIPTPAPTPIPPTGLEIQGSGCALQEPSRTPPPWGLLALALAVGSFAWLNRKARPL